MLTEERKAFIIRVLSESGRIVATELSNMLQVSEDTVRRDLRDLAELGLLRRVHGGALPAAVPKSPTSPSYEKRSQSSPDAKHAIARTASQLIRDGQTVLIDGGTTPLSVAEHLPTELQITVVTHSLPVALALASHRGVRLLLIGGVVFRDYLSTTGAIPVDAYRKIRADVCILGVASVHPTAGIGVLDAEDAEVKRAMIESAAEVICVASSEKLGTASAFIVGPMTSIQHLITDQSASEEVVQSYVKLGIRVTRA